MESPESFEGDGATMGRGNNKKTGEEEERKGGGRGRMTFLPFLLSLQRERRGEEENLNFLSLQEKNS